MAELDKSHGTDCQHAEMTATVPVIGIYVLLYFFQYGSYPANANLESITGTMRTSLGDPCHPEHASCKRPLMRLLRRDPYDRCLEWRPILPLACFVHFLGPELD